MPADPAQTGPTPTHGLPDFVGIGALKAGTSYLDAMLRSHPGLSLPAHVKEVDYFTTHLGRGRSWYENQFATPDGRPRGEVSPQYLFDPNCPQRIAAANPAARLLVNVRHPVARTYSQYRHWVQETGDRTDFETFLEQHPAAAERSLYWQLLDRFRGEFPDRQIHVIVFEELVADPIPVLRGVYAFLGVDPDHVPEAAGQPVNASTTPRFGRLYVQSKKMSRWLYAHGAGRTVARIKATGVDRLLHGQRADRRRPDRPSSAPPPPVAALLAERYRDDVAALSRYTGRDLTALWDL